MPVHKYQKYAKASGLRKNTFLSVNLFPYCQREFSAGQNVIDL